MDNKENTPTKKEVIEYFKGVKTISSIVWPEFLVKLPKKMNVIKTVSGYQVEYSPGLFTLLYSFKHGYSNIEAMTKKGYKMISQLEQEYKDMLAKVKSDQTVIVGILDKEEVIRLGELLEVHEPEVFNKLHVIH